MKMKPISGTRITKLNFEAEKLCDLIYYEGPLLSLFKDISGNLYLYKWSDCDENFNRWLVFPISANELEQYYSAKISLYSIIINKNSLFLVDIDNEIKENLILVTTPTALPDEYLPEEDSFYSLYYSSFETTKIIKEIIKNENN